MKSHLLTLTAAVLAIFAFSSCKKDPGYGDPAVKVNPGELNFKVDGGSETVNLTATVEWTVENSVSWVKVEPMAGDPSKELQPVKVTVSKNEEWEPHRHCHIQADRRCPHRETHHQSGSIYP